MSYDVSRALCGQAGYLSGPGISNANIAATLDAGLDSEPEPHRHQGQGDTKNHRQVTRNRVRRQAWNAIEHKRVIAAGNERSTQSHKNAADDVTGPGEVRPPIDAQAAALPSRQNHAEQHGGKQEPALWSGEIP